MRENLTYGSMRGCWKRSHGDAYTGTKPETADTAKAKPTGHRASALLCARGPAPLVVAARGEALGPSRVLHMARMGAGPVPAFGRWCCPRRVFVSGACLT
jgi:hypothetical protein